MSDLHQHVLDPAKGSGQHSRSEASKDVFRAMLSAVRLTVAFCFALVAGSAWSHHGFSGSYDLSAPVWIEGEVLSAYFGQPHAELTIRTSTGLSVPSPLPDLGTAESFLNAQDLTVRPDTQGATVRVELPPTQQYFGLGNRVAVGDVVAVVAVRNCVPPHQLNGQWLRLASGEVVARSGAMSYMVERC